MRQGRVTTDDEAFNEWLDRSAADLRMMISETPDGPYPYAGVPWFNTVFGRDGIITALSTLTIDPLLARGVLAHLAAVQATTFSPDEDAEPGKILHESRGGEMAALGEVPFGRYYGSVDSTPLVSRARRPLLRANGRSRVHRSVVAEHPARARVDRSIRRQRRRRVRRVRAAAHRPASCIRAGRIRRIRSFTRTEYWPTRQSRCARCRATCSMPSARSARWRGHAATKRSRDNSRTKPIACARASRRRSGAMSSGRMRSHLTATSEPVASAAPMRATACSAGLPRRSELNAWRKRFLHRIHFRVGAFEPSLRANAATTRCRTTTAPCGRTTTRSSPPAFRGTD
jgi:hypothetical protein